MDLAPLLWASSLLRVGGMRITPQGVTLITESTSTSGCCPACGARSARVHSHYSRTLQDLPILGRVVHVELRLRRFFCDLPDCPQETFAERLPDIVEPHARKTSRLVRYLQETAFSTGGEAGSRLAKAQGMPASGNTLLRLLHRIVPPSRIAAPRVLGVDDWAMRRGQVYGTILCDLEAHRPVDLLPERSAEIFAAWLKEHPGAQIISRDRGTEYAKGANLGAPDALQVADRWHLLHNLTDALQEGIAARPSMLNEITAEVTAAMAPALPSAESPSSPVSSPSSPQLTRAQQKAQQRRQRRLERWQKVRELQQGGMGIRKIARTLRMSRNTVEHFAACEQFPERATPTMRKLSVESFLPFLKQRWEEGCDNVKRLWQEIKAKGYAGSVYSVRRQVRRWRRAAGRRPVHGPQPNAAPRIIRPSARRVAWLLLGHVRQPTAQDHAILQAVGRCWPELQETAELCRQFACLLRERDADSLEAWVQLAEGPGILPPVRRFAAYLRQDWAAVVEAARQPWSQGQVEGQINRLKLIKRLMYGRAGFYVAVTRARSSLTLCTRLGRESRLVLDRAVASRVRYVGTGPNRGAVRF